MPWCECPLQQQRRRSPASSLAHRTAATRSQCILCAGHHHHHHHHHPPPQSSITSRTSPSCVDTDERRPRRRRAGRQRTSRRSWWSGAECIAASHFWLGLRTTSTRPNARRTARRQPADGAHARQWRTTRRTSREERLNTAGPRTRTDSTVDAWHPLNTTAGNQSIAN